MKKLIFILKVLNFAIWIQLITACIFVKNSNALSNISVGAGSNNISRSSDINRKTKTVTGLNEQLSDTSDINYKIDTETCVNCRTHNHMQSVNIRNSNISRKTDSIDFKNSSFLSQIRLLGTFAASYTYNFADPVANAEYPQGNYNGNYIDDYKVNGFTINELDLTVSKNAFSDGRHTFGLGFRATFDTGENIQDVGPYTGNYSYYTKSLYNRPLYGFRNLFISLAYRLETV